MSLRFRLTVWFTAILAVALVLFAFLVYALLYRELYTDVDASVQSKAHDAALSVRYEKGVLTAPTRIRVPESQFRAPTLYTEIRSIGGVAIWRSDTLQGSDLPLSSESLATARGGDPVLETVIQAGQSVRLYTAPILVNGNLVGYVQVGRNLADIDVALQQLRLWLLVSIAFALAAAGGGGWLLSQRPFGQSIRSVTPRGRSSWPSGLTVGFLHRRPPTRSVAWSRLSTRCSTVWRPPSSPSNASSPTRLTSFEPL